MESLSINPNILTPKEREIVGLISMGVSTRNDIASSKCIGADSTVPSHLGNIWGRLSNEFFPGQKIRGSRLKILNVAARNNLMLTPDPIFDHLPEDFPFRMNVDSLTFRTRESLFLYSQGLSMNEIASILGIDVRTVSSFLNTAANNFIDIRPQNSGELNECESKGISYTNMAICFIRSGGVDEDPFDNEFPYLFAIGQDEAKGEYRRHLRPRFIGSLNRKPQPTKVDKVYVPQEVDDSYLTLEERKLADTISAGMTLTVEISQDLGMEAKEVKRISKLVGTKVKADFLTEEVGALNRIIVLNALIKEGKIPTIYNLSEIDNIGKVDVDNLTYTEREITLLFSLGLSIDQISHTLGLGRSEVLSHFRGIASLWNLSMDPRNTEGGISHSFIKSAIYFSRSGGSLLDPFVKENMPDYLFLMPENEIKELYETELRVKFLGDNLKPEQQRRLELDETEINIVNAINSGITNNADLGELFDKSEEELFLILSHLYNKVRRNYFPHDKENISKLSKLALLGTLLPDGVEGLINPYNQDALNGGIPIESRRNAINEFEKKVLFLNAIGLDREKIAAVLNRSRSSVFSRIQYAAYKLKFTASKDEEINSDRISIFAIRSGIFLKDIFSPTAFVDGSGKRYYPFTLEANEIRELLETKWQQEFLGIEPEHIEP